MRRLTIALATLVATLSLAGTAGAIVYGAPDGNRHPSTGALLAPEAYSDGTWVGCTGRSSPRVSSSLPPIATSAWSGWRSRSTRPTTPRPGRRYWGTWHADPGYNQSQSDPRDIAVVVLDTPVVGITPARLPAANSLAKLPKNQKFTSVGYGAQSVTIDKGPTCSTTRTPASWALGRSTRSTRRGCGSRGTPQRATPARATATRAARTSSAPVRPRRTSSRRRRSPATSICRATNVTYRLDTDVGPELPQAVRHASVRLGVGPAASRRRALSSRRRR